MILALAEVAKSLRNAAVKIWMIKNTIRVSLRDFLQKISQK